MTTKVEQWLDVMDSYSQRPNQVQEVLMDRYVLPWALRQPYTKNGLVDVCGGQGVEATYLDSLNVPCTVVDKSPTLLAASYHSGHNIRAYADQLPLADQSVSGVMIKDAWMLLNPERRQATLAEIRRVLHPQGSALIVSGVNIGMQVDYFDQNDSRVCAQYAHAFGWREQMDKLMVQGMIREILFPTTSANLQLDALEAGFVPHVLEEYTCNSVLAKESPWPRSAGFIMELQPF